jgi:hypothetical protein
MIKEPPEWARTISERIWNRKWPMPIYFEMGEPDDDRQGGVIKRIRAALKGCSLRVKKYTKLKQA